MTQVLYLEGYDLRGMDADLRTQAGHIIMLDKYLASPAGEGCLLPGSALWEAKYLANPRAVSDQALGIVRRFRVVDTVELSSRMDVEPSYLYHLIPETRGEFTVPSTTPGAAPLMVDWSLDQNVFSCPWSSKNGDEGEEKPSLLAMFFRLRISGATLEHLREVALMAQAPKSNPQDQDSAPTSGTAKKRSGPLTKTTSAKKAVS